MTDAQVDEMVNRFLCWKLPKDFAPDAGITFNPGHNSPNFPHWPIGTNLLTAEQAKEMICHIVDVPNGGVTP